MSERELEHARTQAEREQLPTDRDALKRTLQQTKAELDALPRWGRGRRRALTDTITRSEQQLGQTAPTLASLNAQIDRLTRQLATTPGSAWPAISPDRTVYDWTRGT